MASLALIVVLSTSDFIFKWFTSVSYTLLFLITIQFIYPLKEASNAGFTQGEEKAIKQWNNTVDIPLKTFDIEEKAAKDAEAAK